MQGVIAELERTEPGCSKCKVARRLTAYMRRRPLQGTSSLFLRGVGVWSYWAETVAVHSATFCWTSVLAAAAVLVASAIGTGAGTGDGAGCAGGNF
jgi:hypothetical protein